MAMRKIAIINQKGGSGKTTTTLNVGACMARKGHKVLLIDTDPQGNLTTSAGIKTNKNESTLYEVLKGQADINEAIIPTEGGYDLIPTDIRQSGADIALSSEPGRDFILREAIEGIKTQYDYILIDCPPSLSVITLMSLTACDKVIIPVQAQYLALQGMAQLIDTINVVRKRMNPNLEIAGVVLTMYDRRKNLDSTVKAHISRSFPDKLYNTMISNNVALAEAPGYGLDVFRHAPKSKGAEQYTELTEEILRSL